ncbi:MAG: redox-regulated ATPase YchF [Bacillota bacterium]
MSFSLGIVGLPNAGKSTLFNAIVSGKAATAPYPFTTIDPNRGVVRVPDQRLDAIAKAVGSEKVTYPCVEIVDIAGLVKGASRGEGLGNQFLAHIREVDGIIHVVRAFGNGVSALQDAEVVDLELALADLGVLERQLESWRGAARSGKKEAVARLEALESIKDHLERGCHVRQMPQRYREIGDELFLITSKPMLYVSNVGEEYASRPMECKAAAQLEVYASKRGSPTIGLCAKLEEELAALPEPERRSFGAELGINQLASEKVVLMGYKMLGLITFYTANRNEARAWAVKEGCTALEAAGKVHSQMAKGFVKAEVISSQDLVAAGSLARARDLGLVRIEGRDYRITDGDLLYVRFTG